MIGKNSEWNSLYNKKIKPVSSLSLSEKNRIEFITIESNDDSGNYVVAHEVIGNRNSIVQKTGNRYRKFTLTCIVGKDDYWQQDADKFLAICHATSNDHPAVLEGCPQIPNTRCIIGTINKQVTSKRGTTTFTIEVYPVYDNISPTLNYQKILLDRVSDMIDSWTVKVNNAFAYVEVVESYLQSFHKVFNSVANLLNSGLQSITLTSNLLGSLRGSVHTGDAMQSAIDSYIFATEQLIKTASPSRLVNSHHLYYHQSYPYSSQKLTSAQIEFSTQFSNLSSLNFIGSSLKKVNEAFMTFEHIVKYRQILLSILNNMINNYLYYKPDSDDIHEMYLLLNDLNNFFSQLYPKASKGKSIVVDRDILPQVFYFNHTGTQENYRLFLQDNALDSLFFLEKGQEVFIRDVY
ncbi:MAG: hypothetical protein ACRC0X_02155 [Brevinema sp.]